MIEKAENRELFKKSMLKIGLDSPKGYVVNSLEKCCKFQKSLFPIIIRPSFTLGGSGGGTAGNHKEFVKIVKKGSFYLQLMKF